MAAAPAVTTGGLVGEKPPQIVGEPDPVVTVLLDQFPVEVVPVGWVPVPVKTLVAVAVPTDQEAALVGP